MVTQPPGQSRARAPRTFRALPTSGATHHPQLGGSVCPDQLLSASEQAEFRSSLAAAGYSDSDVVHTQDRWSLGSGGRPCLPLLEAPVRQNVHSRSKPSCAHCTSNHMLCSLQTRARIRQLARKLRQPSAELPSLATRISRLEPPDSSLNPFAEWPWEPCDSPQTSRTSGLAVCCATCYASATSHGTAPAQL